MTIEFDDDFDPLAPPDYGDVADGEVVEQSAGGFSDSDGIVRIWFEGGLLSKVRISPVWFHKVLGDDTLEGHFRQAFANAAFAVTEPPSEGADHDTEPERYEEFERLPALSPASLSAFARLFEEHEARIDAALRQRGEPMPGGSATEGTALGVTVVLDARGRPESVRFEEDWLDDVQVGAIAAAVVAAAADAHGRYEAPEVSSPELDDLFEQRELLLAAHRAMLNPRRSHR